MTRDEAKAAITGKLIEAYGFQEGLSVAGVCAEPILNDFEHMLAKALPGQTVSEEYKTEDRRAEIRISGTGGRNARILSVELI